MNPDLLNYRVVSAVECSPVVGSNPGQLLTWNKQVVLSVANFLLLLL